MGWLLASIDGMALREVADVNQCLPAVGWDVELVEERTRATAQLRHAYGLAGRAMRVPHGVGATLGDTGEERLRGQRPVDGRLRAETESRYAAHEPLFDSVDRTTLTVDDVVMTVFVKAAFIEIGFSADRLIPR